MTTTTTATTTPTTTFYLVRSAGNGHFLLELRDNHRPVDADRAAELAALFPNNIYLEAPEGLGVR